MPDKPPEDFWTIIGIKGPYYPAADESGEEDRDLNMSALWPRVTSPVARRVMAAADRLPRYRWVESRRQDYVRRIRWFPVMARRYRDWVRGALDSSNIAQKLAADFRDELVDSFEQSDLITAAMRRGSIEQIVSITCVQLPVLLEPGTGARKLAGQSLNMVALTGSQALICSLWIIRNHSKFVGLTFGLFACIFLILTIFRLPQVIRRVRQGRDCWQQQNIAATELYLYLKEAYSDAPGQPSSANAS